MERLTERDEYGNADIRGVDSADLQLHLNFEELNLVTDALNRLADYEETGIMPEEVKRLVAAKQDNPALTVKELREMEREPVYLVYPYMPEKNRWDILVEVDEDYNDEYEYWNEEARFTNDEYDSLRHMGEDWLAYRRKPDETQV